MNPFIQRTLLWTYGLIRRTGLLTDGPGAWIYETAYDLYKLRLEAGPVLQLRRHIQPGEWVIDVGAHVGFFTTRFARWISDEAKVVACEPEAENRMRLVRRIERQNLLHLVDIVPAAIADREGNGRLAVNHDHPGDHRLGDEGVDVPVRTLDGLMAERGWPKVGLIKIDVQGAEALVIEGALQTIQHSRPALMVEVDDKALQRFGASAPLLIKRLWEIGYASAGPIGKQNNVMRTLDGALEEWASLKDAYVDLLFVSRAAGHVA